MHARSLPAMHGLALLLEIDATLELLCELLASGVTHAALTLLQLTPHTTTFHHCLRMVSSVTIYLDADVAVATASCCCYRSLSLRDLHAATANSGSLTCHLSDACLNQQHQLAITLEMGCVPHDLHLPHLLMGMGEKETSRERCLSSPASDTSDDAGSLCEPL